MSKRGEDGKDSAGFRQRPADRDGQLARRETDLVALRRSSTTKTPTRHQHTRPRRQENKRARGGRIFFFSTWNSPRDKMENRKALS